MTTTRNLTSLIGTVLLLTLAASGCMGPSGSTVKEKQMSALSMKEEALACLYDDHPEAKAKIEKSVGYGVFSNFGIHPGLLSFASGYGVLTNKTTGKDTHQKFFRLTIGPGIAVKGLYGVLIFEDTKALEIFEKGPWAVFGQVEASFVFGDFGGSAEHAWLYGKGRGVDVYYTTHTGVALELEIIGLGKITNNDKLNKPASP
jgi:hypothetical protein